MTTPMARRMARDGEGTVCPHHPQGSDHVCVEVAHSLSMNRRWAACHSRLMCIWRAMEGERSERRALEHPSPTPDMRTLLNLPPVTGWTCVPRDKFERETMRLTEDTLKLAQLQLKWEMEEKEEEERRRAATPVPPPCQVCRNWVKLFGTVMNPSECPELN